METRKKKVTMQIKYGFLTLFITAMEFDYIKP